MIEFWGQQVLDCLKTIHWLHENGYAAGCIDAENVFYKSNKEAWGMLHCPIIQELEE